jgi:hypothetical protein
MDLYQSLSQAFAVTVNPFLVQTPQTSLRSRLAEITAEYEAFKEAHQVRITEFDALNAEVFSLFLKLEIPDELEISIPDDVTRALQTVDISTETRKKVVEYQKDEIDRQKSVLLRLWDVLTIRTAERDCFTKQHSTLGESVLDADANEITKLKAQREEHLPEIIPTQLADVNRIEAELHRLLTRRRAKCKYCLGCA